MADQADVAKGYVGLIDGILYPNGQSGNPPKTILGVPARIGRGWPDQKQLDADLRAGVLNVWVVPRLNMERNTTRYATVREELAAPQPTYGLAKSGQVVSVGGGPPSPYVPQNFAVTLNGVVYVAQALAGQTAAQVAAALLAAIQVDYPGTTLSGSDITVPIGVRIGDILVGSTGSTIREVGRQEKQFQISFWCADPDIRDAAVGAVDPVLRITTRLALADGTEAKLTYQGSNSWDGMQKELLYRRDLFYLTEFATILTETAAQLLFTGIEVIAGNGQPILELDFSDPANSGLLPLI